jgi:ubiquinone/menaquinone biosynthesis C-methylase UbiE
MSLRGRYVIDRVKRSLSPYLRLPVPPYGNPSYWEGAYLSLGPSDVYEWGHHSCSDLLNYEYTSQEYDPLVDTLSLAKSAKGKTKPRIATTLGETLQVQPAAKTDEPIIVLGCGNSEFGEHMLKAGWRGPFIQVDVAARAIESMSHRCSAQQQTGDMQFVQDDATVLSAFSDNKAAAVFDKGLVDALFCANEYQQCYSVMQSVQRVLQPDRVFAFLSFSRPEFLMEQLLLPPDGVNKKNRKMAKNMWDDIQVRKLDYIYLYRFQKASTTATVRGGGSNASSSRKGRQRR